MADDTTSRPFDAIPLGDLPRHYSALGQSLALRPLLLRVLELCPPGGRCLEAEIGSGLASIWVSRRGRRAEGRSATPELVERARQANHLLGGSATFAVGGLFDLHRPDRQRVDVIFHQGALEHFPVPQLHAALAQQVASARWVVFSVPSVYYPFEPEQGDERLLPVEEWQHLLAPFGVEELRYYGDPALGGQEHILAVLRGQEADESLQSLMRVPDEPYPEGISGIVHTRNEAQRIAACLDTLQGWTDEIIVCDMESTDATVAIASRYTDQIVHHPLIANFDRARNVSAMRARYRWVLYVDADERVPPGLGPALRELTATRGETFEALLLPMRHHFGGHWLQSLYPGYTSPRLFRNGRFSFHTRLHAGAQVDGRVVLFNAADPNLAVLHLTCDSLTHLIEKQNVRTDGEAENLDRDGRRFTWQTMVQAFVQDFRGNYDGLHGRRDGVHGLLWGFMSGFYRFQQHAKLFERHWRDSRLEPGETEVPGSVEELLEYALSVARQRPVAPPPSLVVDAEARDAADVVWQAPWLTPTGYGEEGRQFILALDRVGVAVAAPAHPHVGPSAALSAAEAERLSELSRRPARPGFIQVFHAVPYEFDRHPQAAALIGRTMFETDRIPPFMFRACERFDQVWVPSEFNRRTFSDAGVPPEKLNVIPGCLDMAQYAGPGRPGPAAEALRASGRFVFLSVFNWTLRKGWDVLLRAFLAEFGTDEPVQLVLKVWSAEGYGVAGIRQQAADLARREFGIDLLADPRVCFLHERLDREAMVALYRASDAFVLASRGEGWGRPYMEAMAVGLPSIGTGWSGNLDFMSPENSYLIDSDVESVTEAGWREFPIMQGHRWAEPRVAHLRELLRRVTVERGEAAAIGARGRDSIVADYDCDVVGRRVAAELTRIRELHTVHPPVAPPAPRARPAVRWEGDLFEVHSLAHVNRELCRGLLPLVDLSVVPRGGTRPGPGEESRCAALAERAFAPLRRPADVHVRHFFPPRLDPPEEGHLVLMQPWEYGYLPREWVEPIRRNVREVWCYSSYVRQVYRDSGIPEERLQLVPLGVDAGVFRPEAPPHILTTEPGAERLVGRRPFVFLFAGGSIERKGIGILLDAWRRAFTPLDDVLLLVKDTGTRTVYRGQNQADRITSMAADPTVPPVAYVDADLSPHQLAGIYTAAHCLVMPYRGEGFLLPALEALACGRPVIVPAGGATDDFVDDAVGWQAPAERRLLEGAHVARSELAGPGWQLEVAVDDLARLLRQVAGSPEDAERRGTAGRERVAAGWTWAHSVAVARQRLEALAQEPGVRAKAVQSKRRPRAAGPARPRLSLCMIVKNEERVLDACLTSVEPWVDELVVVDTGSTDRTAVIAEAHGAKVHHFPWCDDFGAARNASLVAATGDWIFWMDADDVLPEECGRRLREEVMLADERTYGLLMQVHCPPAPGETGLTVVDHVKLFRNLPGLRFEGRIHEQILESIHRAGGNVERTDLYVVHAGYDHSEAGQQRKRERDLRLLELDLAERPDHPFVLFNIGMTAFHLRDWPRATASLTRCLEVSGQRDSTTRKVYAMLAGCALETDDKEGARAWIEHGLAQFPHDPELLFRGGVVYREVGEPAAAEQCYLHLLQARETGHIDSLDVTMLGFKAHHNLALVYQDLGRLDRAEACWWAAVQANPRFEPSWQGLREVYARTGRWDQVRATEARLAELAAEAVGYGRRETIDRTLEKLAERSGQTIVELGSIRIRGNLMGDGYSTVAWAKYAAGCGGQVWSVDLDPHATALTREETAAYAGCVDAVTMDGHAFLDAFEQPIDLLYLDAVEADDPASGEWHLRAFQLAEPRLHERSLVLIDGTDQPNRGKGALVIPYSLEHGWRVVREGRQQVLLERE